MVNSNVEYLPNATTIYENKLNRTKKCNCRGHSVEGIINVQLALSGDINTTSFDLSEVT